MSQPSFADSSRTSTAQNMYADGFLMPQDVISWRDQQTTSCYTAPVYADPNNSVRAPPSPWPESRGDRPTPAFLEETKKQEDKKIHMFDYWMQPSSYMEELKKSGRRSESQWTPDATPPFFTTGSLSTPESRWARVDPGFKQSTPSFNQYTSSSYATGRWTSIYESDAMKYRQMHNYMDVEVQAPQEAVMPVPVIEETPIALNEPDIRVAEPTGQEVSASVSEPEPVYLSEPVLEQPTAPWSQPDPVVETATFNEDFVMEMPSPEPVSTISKDLAEKISAYEKKIEEMREVEAEFVDILNQSRSRYVNDLNDILTVESSSDYDEEEYTSETQKDGALSSGFEEHPGAETSVEVAATTTASYANTIDVLEAELGDEIMSTIRRESHVNTPDAYLSAGSSMYQSSYYGSPAPQYSTAGRSGPNVYHNGYQNAAPHYSNAYDRPLSERNHWDRIF